MRNSCACQGIGVGVVGAACVHSVLPCCVRRRLPLRSLRVCGVPRADWCWLCCCRCKLWDAAANDTVGGRQHHKGPNGISKQMMERYSGMSASDRKAKLAAIKCTGLVNGLRLAALSRPNF